MNTMLVTVELIGLSRVPLEHIPAMTAAWEALMVAMSAAGLETRGSGLNLSEIGDDHDREDT